MRYVLNENYFLCGWKKLPFAMMDRVTGRALLMNRERFAFLLKMSGKKDLEFDAEDPYRDMLSDLLAHNIIHEAAEGETRDLDYTEYKGVYKKSVQWSVTGKCNYRCRHCLQSAPEGILGEPTLAQCLDIIRQLEQCGIRQISITGGEPLVRNDFFQILDEIRRRGLILTTLYTNGKLVTQELLDGLKARGMKPGFQISFDGVGFHDWMRGVAGAEKTALDAFRLLRDNGFNAGSAMCLCRENVGSIRETVKVLASVGCRSLKLQCAMPQGEWCAQAEHYLTIAETLQAYLDYLPCYKEDGCPIDIQMEGFFAYVKEEGGYYSVCDRAVPEEALGYIPPCGVITSSLFIGPNGAVTPCMSMCGTEIEKQFPNIFETPLEDILYDSSFTELTSKRVDYVLEHTAKCSGCKYRCRCCGGCRAMGTGQNGNDYFAPDPVTCEMFLDGWVDKLYETADLLFTRVGQAPEEHEC